MEEILKEKPERILEITADKGYEQEEGRPNLLPGKCDYPHIMEDGYALRILYEELKAEENQANIEKLSSIYETAEDMLNRAIFLVEGLWGGGGVGYRKVKVVKLFLKPSIE